MIVFIPRENNKWVVANRETREYYPANQKATSLTKCWNSAKVREWLPKRKFKIEEL